MANHAAKSDAQYGVRILADGIQYWDSFTSPEQAGRFAREAIKKYKGARVSILAYGKSHSIGRFEEEFLGKWQELPVGIYGKSAVEPKEINKIIESAFDADS